MSESKKCNANWNKLDTKDYIVYSFIWSSKTVKTNSK
jgi:hypothetical protein